MISLGKNHDVCFISYSQRSTSISLFFLMLRFSSVEKVFADKDFLPGEFFEGGAMVEKVVGTE